mgnify:CR=1 FL=1
MKVIHLCVEIFQWWLEPLMALDCNMQISWLRRAWTSSSSAGPSQNWMTAPKKLVITSRIILSSIIWFCNHAFLESKYRVKTKTIAIDFTKDLGIYDRIRQEVNGYEIGVLSKSYSNDLLDAFISHFCHCSQQCWHVVPLSNFLWRSCGR